MKILTATPPSAIARGSTLTDPGSISAAGSDLTQGELAPATFRRAPGQLSRQRRARSRPAMCTRARSTVTLGRSRIPLGSPGQPILSEDGFVWATGGPGA